MEIKAKCKFDLETVKALTYLTMFKRGNPKKRMTSLNVLFSVLLAIVILEIIAFGMDIYLVLVAISGIVILLTNIYMGINNGSCNIKILQSGFRYTGRN